MQSEYSYLIAIKLLQKTHKHKIKHKFQQEVLRMKKHKIRNVDISVCCAEQKIAYNLAFSHCTNFKEQYEKIKGNDFLIADFVIQLRDFAIKLYKQGRDYTGRYDIDLIQHCLHNGIENYFKANCKICSSYEEIGKIFPCLY